MRFLMIALVRLYQVTLSPFIGGSCRFDPSCSQYAVQCLADHGALRGTGYAIKRIARCHPWGGYGYDPPPKKVKHNG